MTELYNRVRAWRRALGLNSAVAQLLPMVEECSELETARTQEDRADAIGDKAVTAIVLYDVQAEEGDLIELGDVSPVSYSTLVCLGLIAEGIRKPKKSHQVAAGCRSMLQLARQDAVMHGLDFEKQCLAPVVDILEARLKQGYTMNAGTAVKMGDS